MIRCRFQIPGDDPRPETHSSFPYFVLGYSRDKRHAVLIAYAVDELEIKQLWPEASRLESVDAPWYAGLIERSLYES